MLCRSVVGDLIFLSSDALLALPTTAVTANLSQATIEEIYNLYKCVAGMQ